MSTLKKLGKALMTVGIFMILAAPVMARDQVKTKDGTGDGDGYCYCYCNTCTCTPAE